MKYEYKYTLKIFSKIPFKVTLGAVHKLRRQNFEDDAPPPSVDKFTS